MVSLAPIKCVDGKYATDENGFLYKLNQFGTSKAVRVILSRYGKKNNAYFDIVHNGKKIRFYQDWLKDMQENAVGKIMGDWK